MSCRQRCSRALALLPLAAFLVTATRVTAAILEVPTSYPTIQAALNAAGPGDTVLVRAGVYSEKVRFTNGGAPGAFLTLSAAPNETVVLDGAGVTGANMILVESKSWVRIQGLELRNNLQVTDGSGIRIVGSGSHIEIRDNRIHDMRGKNAMGITVYGTDPAPISDLVIEGNEIFDCEPAPSEALVLNGNVTNFAVRNNYVHDVNNIGIDFIGGERDIQPDPTKVARSGVCEGNRVLRARSSYGGGFAAGIYVDGGRDILIQNNEVRQSDLGIEVGAENAGVVASGIVVRNNLLAFNEKSGLVFGGYSPAVGRVQNSVFENNTLYHNDTLWSGFGELWIQWAENNVVRNNLVVAGKQNLLLVTTPGATNNTLDYNLWFGPTSESQSRWVWQDEALTGFAAYRTRSGQDSHSQFTDPSLRAPAEGDFHLEPNSAAVDAGDPTTNVPPGTTDLDDAPRLNGARVDIGADEMTCGNNTVDPGEVCDDGNTTDCDGCDRNCTPSGQCGNRIVCGSEQCDDGNQHSGDCCSASCQFEPAGSPCDDGRLCTTGDQCNGSGSCSGIALPRTSCIQPNRPGASRLRIADATNDARDLLQWSWRATSGTNSADLGDPQSSTDYALCVFDSANNQPSLVAELPVSSGGSCSGRACWRARRGGFVYRNRWANEAGVRALHIAARSSGAATMSLQAKGPKLSLPALPLSQQPEVVAELRNSLGRCWQARMTTPAKRNGAAQFSDASD
ncbi:MAG: hypothetical protein KatS3mg077_1779 [Candidatus Binatia bacterium]|nr:MAG: hypothetical protein KatS3mg077_1779 [Candidatus Binatia bacterium]